MKCAVVFVGCMLWLGAFGQQPYQIAVGYNKTSSLIFPFAIKSVDRGSRGVLVQKAKGVDNILQVKAAVRDFAQTNLSVVTSDGKFYSFLLDYLESPEVLMFSINPNEHRSIITGQVMDEATYDLLSDSIARSSGYMRRHLRREGLELLLKGIYLKRGVMWFQMELRNQSLVDFEPASLRLFVRDKRKLKRTAIQETELASCFPMHRWPVPGYGGRSLTFGMAAFALPSSKKMIVQLREQNVGRTLELSIPARLLRNIKTYQYEKR